MQLWVVKCREFGRVTWGQRTAEHEQWLDIVRAWAPTRTARPGRLPARGARSGQLRRMVDQHAIRLALPVSGCHDTGELADGYLSSLLRWVILRLR